MAYVRCWHCQGSGLLTMPDRPRLVWKTWRCGDCNSTGCDIEATKKYVSKWERNFPKPLPNPENLETYYN